MRSLAVIGLVLALFLVSCTNVDTYPSDFAKWSLDLTGTVRRDIPFGKSALTQSQTKDLLSALKDLTSRLSKMRPPPLVRSEHQELLMDMTANTLFLQSWESAAAGSGDVQAADVIRGAPGSPDVLQLVAQIQKKLGQ